MIQTKAHARRNFETQVESWIADALKAGACSFPEILARLPGVFPSVALDALDRMKRQGRLSPEAANTLGWQVAASAPARLLDLMTCHPRIRLISSGGSRNAPPASFFRWRRLLPNQRSRCPAGTPAVAAIATAAPIDRATVFVGEDNVITSAVMALNDRNGRPLAIQTCNRRRCCRGMLASLSSIPLGISILSARYSPSRRRPAA